MGNEKKSENKNKKTNVVIIYIFIKIKKQANQISLKSNFIFLRTRKIKKMTKMTFFANCLKKIILRLR